MYGIDRAVALKIMQSKVRWGELLAEHEGEDLVETLQIWMREFPYFDAVMVLDEPQELVTVAETSINRDKHMWEFLYAALG